MNFLTKLESPVPNVPLGKDFATKICAVSIFKPVLQVSMNFISLCKQLSHLIIFLPHTITGAIIFIIISLSRSHKRKIWIKLGLGNSALSLDRARLLTSPVKCKDLVEIEPAISKIYFIICRGLR